MFGLSSRLSWFAGSAWRDEVHSKCQGRDSEYPQYASNDGYFIIVLALRLNKNKSLTKFVCHSDHSLLGELSLDRDSSGNSRNPHPTMQRNAMPQRSTEFTRHFEATLNGDPPVSNQQHHQLIDVMPAYKLKPQPVSSQILSIITHLSTSSLNNRGAEC